MADPTPVFGKTSQAPQEATIGAMAALDNAIAAAAAAEKKAEVKAEPEAKLPTRKEYRSTREDLQSHRALVESRVKPFECKDILTSGRLTQEVCIHSKLLTVVFQDITQQEKRAVARLVDSKAGGQLERQFLANMLPMSLCVKSINGLELPKADPDQDTTLMARIDFVSERISGSWLDLLWHNYTWFLERCSEFTTEELGNG